MWKSAADFLAKDKYLGVVVVKYGHCDITPRVHSDYFQGLVGEIIGQQLSGRVADVIFKRLKVITQGRVTPQKIVLLEDQKLRDCGMAWAKVRSIKDLTQRVMDGKLRLKGLNEMSDEEVAKELMAVKGIGKWTSEMFLMFTLGRKDIFPDGDLGIRKAVKVLLKKDIDQDKLAKFARRWKPYRTAASWYLWRLIDGEFIF